MLDELATADMRTILLARGVAAASPLKGISCKYIPGPQEFVVRNSWVVAALAVVIGIHRQYYTFLPDIRFGSSREGFPMFMFGQ